MDGHIESRISDRLASSTATNTMRNTTWFFIAAVSGGPLFARLTPEQRAFDFQSLSAMLARRYAPIEWKKQAYGYDLLDVKPWLARVSAAKDDLEFFEIEAEYIAKLNDVHTGFQMTSTFSASLGMTVDIYDELIDSINRGLLPVSTYPFGMGDELVSLDGKPVEWISAISKYRARGNPSTTRRAAAGQITARSQSAFPCRRIRGRAPPPRFAAPREIPRLT